MELERTMRYWLKECPRCQGDLQEEKDFYGQYISCVQCGFIPDASREERLLSAPTAGNGRGLLPQSVAR
jgi:hypothetical protein